MGSLSNKLNINLNRPTDICISLEAIQATRITYIEREREKTIKAFFKSKSPVFKKLRYINFTIFLNN